MPQKKQKKDSKLVRTTEYGTQIYQYSYELNDTEKASAKTIVVMGGTGTGKTTLLNAYVNYLQGI